MVPHGVGDCSLRRLPIIGMNQSKPGCHCRPKVPWRLGVELMHSIAPPQVQSVSCQLVDSGACRASGNPKPNRHGLEHCSPFPFCRNVRFQACLQPAACSQNEQHRQNRSDDECPSDSALLVNRRGNGVFDHKLIPPPEVVVDLLGERIALCDACPSRQERVESCALGNGGGKIVNQYRGVTDGRGLASIGELGEPRRRSVQRLDRLGTQCACVDGVCRSVSKSFVIRASIVRQYSQGTRMFQSRGPPRIGGHLQQQHHGDR